MTFQIISVGAGGLDGTARFHQQLFSIICIKQHGCVFNCQLLFFPTFPFPHPTSSKNKNTQKNLLKQQEDADVERVNRRNDRRFVRIETQDFFFDTFYLKCETREVKEIKMEEF